MIRPELLAILCCPLTRQGLSPLDQGAIGALNQRIVSSQIKNRSGQLVAEALDGGLITADNQWIYPVRNNIPVLLINEAIQNPETVPSSQTPSS